MLKKCTTCKTLGEATDFTRRLIRDEEVRKALRQKEPAIAIDAVKGYLAPGGEKKPPVPQP
jgi:hypothetical protein